MRSWYYKNYTYPLADLLKKKITFEKPEHFVETGQLDELNTILRKSSKGLMFYGDSGIGKSTCFKELASQDNGVLYIKLKSFNKTKISFETQIQNGLGNCGFQEFYIVYGHKGEIYQEEISEYLERMQVQIKKLQLNKTFKRKRPILIFDDFHVLISENKGVAKAFIQTVKDLTQWYQIILVGNPILNLENDLEQNGRFPAKVFPHMSFNAAMQYFEKIVQNQIEQLPNQQEKTFIQQNYKLFSKFVTSRFDINEALACDIVEYLRSTMKETNNSHTILQILPKLTTTYSLLEKDFSDAGMTFNERLKKIDFVYSNEIDKKNVQLYLEEFGKLINGKNIEQEHVMLQDSSLPIKFFISKAFKLFMDIETYKKIKFASKLHQIYFYHNICKLNTI